jgi:hypothetical protein
MYLQQRKVLEVDGQVKEDLVTKCTKQMTKLLERHMDRGTKINPSWASRFGTTLYREGLSEEQREKVWDQIIKRQQELLDDANEESESQKKKSEV